MTPEETRPVDRFELPFGKEVVVQEVVFEDDVRLLRLRIREGARFTIVDLDPRSAAAWGGCLSAWAETRQGT